MYLKPHPYDKMNKQYLPSESLENYDYVEEDESWKTISTLIPDKMSNQEYNQLIYNTAQKFLGPS